MSNPRITGVAAGVVGNVTGTDVLEPQKHVENEPKKDILEKSDENEQTELQLANDDKNEKSILDNLKNFGKNILNKLTGKKESGWKALSERKQELQKRMNEALQQEPSTNEQQEIEEQIKEIEEMIKKDIEPSEKHFS